jgi:hypothetical protein
MIMVKRSLMLGICLAGLVSQGFADPAKRTLFSRDRSYEEYLHIRGNPDDKITPARVIRWIQGLRGESLRAPANTEFQPIVNANEGHYKVIAAICFKFF